MESKKIWIDLDNSPHVPLFVPIKDELEKRGHTVFITTRHGFQVCSLADHHNLKHKQIGKHYGANRLLKVLGTVWRSLQLAPSILKEKPDLSLSHGSRSMMLLSHFIRIPTVLMFDYEHAYRLPFLKPVLGIAPEAIDDHDSSRSFERGLCRYRGLKEDVYVASFKPDPSFLKSLDLNEEDILATIRPPATEAHYHNPESEQLFYEVVEFLGRVPYLRMVILPRNAQTQREMIYGTWAKWCKEGKIIVPNHAIDGLNLVWHSDLVVSGGGTMNREAAALGVPVYSIFRGKIGAVDRYLAEKERLTLIETVDDVRAKIRPVRRPKTEMTDFSERAALKDIMDAIDKAIYMI
jgi:uncharacterized protein